jgi:hypothetical protein
VRVLVLDEVAGAERLVLHSWDRNGKQQPERELLRGKRLLAVPTLDDRYLCVRDILPSPEERLAVEDRRAYGWSVVAVATGEQVAWLPYEAGTQSLAVLGSRAFVLVAGTVRGPVDRVYSQPRTLKAHDLKTGKLLWERPLDPKPVAPPPVSKVETPPKKS